MSERHPTVTVSQFSKKLPPVLQPSPRDGHAHEHRLRVSGFRMDFGLRVLGKNPTNRAPGPEAATLPPMYPKHVEFSQVPREWSSEHEVAWCWLWENVAAWLWGRWWR